MSKMIYTISDVTGQTGQKRLDHYNKWLMDPKREIGSTYPGFPDDKVKKSPLSRKKGKMMEAVVEDVVVAPVKVSKPLKVVKPLKVEKAPGVVRTGTKLAQATDIVKATGKDDKEACLLAIVGALSVTRGNASIYYAKALAKLV